MFQTILLRKNKTLSLYSVIISDNRATYDIMWKNTEETVRSQVRVQYDLGTLYAG
jgi:hypothetical protein